MHHHVIGRQSRTLVDDLDLEGLAVRQSLYRFKNCQIGARPFDVAERIKQSQRRDAGRGARHDE